MAVIQKSRRDDWDASSPPRVTNYLQLSLSSWSYNRTYHSPICGFGWRFHGRLDGRGQRLNVSLDPHLCSGMHSMSFDIAVSVHSSNTDTANPLYQTSYTDGCNGDDERTLLSDYQVDRRSPIEITVSFSFKSLDASCFPEPPPPPPPSGTGKVLLDLVQASLRKPSLADIKLYLYSAKAGRQPAKPKPLFGNTDILRDAAPYWETMLSETGFQSGTPCDLFAEEPGVIQQLSSGDYGYDSDSDLESISDEDGTGIEEAPTVELDALSIGEEAPSSTSRPREHLTPKASGIAYAFNGTAHRTLEAYITYIYTNEVQFNPLKSTTRLQRSRTTGKDLNRATRCSPKSMYRFADYAGIPTLKAKAKGGIEQGLTKENIVTELFSSFTSKYDEIIEMETEFLVKNFTTPELERAFVEILVNTKQYCPRTLIFAFKMLRGGNVAAAWEMANSTTSA